jgi:hypothetical protein
MRAEAMMVSHKRGPLIASVEVDMGRSLVDMTRQGYPRCRVGGKEGLGAGLDERS